MITLPREPIKVEVSDPRRLVIASHTKVGKTSLIEGLPNHILIDLEDGSGFVEAAKINIKAEADKNSMHILDTLKAVADSIRQENEKAGKKIYDFIVLDTTTAIEDIAGELAAIMYRQTPLGKNWKGSQITNLPNGAGYGWLREAFETIYKEFDGLYGKALILFAHTKKSSITKDGKELAARDINLTGKLKNIVCADADAIGFMYRDKTGTKNILSFKTSPEDLSTGARPPHLRNEEFVISELVEGKVKTNWDRVFLSLNN